MLSRYFGREFTKPSVSTDSVAKSTPITAKAIATTLSTAKTGGNPQCSRRDTTGLNKKLIKAASTIGSKSSFPHQKAERMTIRYASPTSLRISKGFLDSGVSGIELFSFGISDASEVLAIQFARNKPIDLKTPSRSRGSERLHGNRKENNELVCRFERADDNTH